MLSKTAKKSISKIILPFDAVKSKGEYVKLACTLDYELGQYRQDALVRLIRDTIISFALTPQEIETFISQGDFGEMQVLAWSRISKVIKEKKGDYGEILLYLITEQFFNAPKLVTKVILKSSNKDQVKGFDCAHFQFEENRLTLFLGEAKLHKSFYSGLSSAIGSITEHSTKDFMTDEFSILLPNVQKNVDVSQELLDRVIPILNRTESLDNVNICMPILIAFDAKEIQQGSSLRDEEHIKRLVKLFKSKFDLIEAQEIEVELHRQIEFRFILLPFKSIDEFREMLERIEGAMRF